jgi:hypothetical protein
MKKNIVFIFYLFFIANIFAEGEKFDKDDILYPCDNPKIERDSDGYILNIDCEKQKTNEDFYYTFETSNNYLYILENIKDEKDKGTIVSPCDGIVYDIKKTKEEPKLKYIAVRCNTNNLIVYMYYLNPKSINRKKNDMVKSGEKIGLLGFHSDARKYLAVDIYDMVREVYLNPKQVFYFNDEDDEIIPPINNKIINPLSNTNISNVIVMRDDGEEKDKSKSE